MIAVCHCHSDINHNYRAGLASVGIGEHRDYGQFDGDYVTVTDRDDDRGDDDDNDDDVDDDDDDHDDNDTLILLRPFTRSVNR